MLRYLVVWGLVVVASAQRAAVVSIVGSNSTSRVAGTVYFTEIDGGILISGNITGLTPGQHGFHVHAFGDLSGSCLSTGGHFNPYNNTHGAPNDTARHTGDLGNIQANSAGVATLNFTDNGISLSGITSIIGRGVVVHQDVDDLGLGGYEDSKTTGHAGARVGCGVIGTLDEVNPLEPSGAPPMVLSSLLALVMAVFHRVL